MATGAQPPIPRRRAGTPEPRDPKIGFLLKAKPRQSPLSETLPETHLQSQLKATEPVPSTGTRQPPALRWHQQNPKASDEKGRAGKGRLMQAWQKKKQRSRKGRGMHRPFPRADPPLTPAAAGKDEGAGERMLCKEEKLASSLF